MFVFTTLKDARIVDRLEMDGMNPERLVVDPGNPKHFFCGVDGGREYKLK
jgi:hypothetical protein